MYIYKIDCDRCQHFEKKVWVSLQYELIKQFPKLELVRINNLCVDENLMKCVRWYPCIILVHNDIHYIMNGKNNSEGIIEYESHCDTSEITEVHRWVSDILHGYPTPDQKRSLTTRLYDRAINQWLKFKGR